jgi:lysophospholipase L1-like esterase
MAAACRARGVPLVAALLPELHATGAEYPFEAEHRLLESMARARGIPLIDLRRALPAGGDPRRLWVSADDAHPNAEAHAAYARFLAESVDWPALVRGEPRVTDAN